MFVNLNIPSYDEFLRKFVYSFRSRIQDSGNSLVNCGVMSSLPFLVKYRLCGVMLYVRINFPLRAILVYFL